MKSDIDNYIKKYKPLTNKIVIDSDEKKKYRFLGIATCTQDSYYILRDENNKIIQNSMVGKLEVDKDQSSKIEKTNDFQLQLMSLIEIISDIKSLIIKLIQNKTKQSQNIKINEYIDISNALITIYHTTNNEETSNVHLRHDKNLNKFHLDTYSNNGIKLKSVEVIINNKYHTIDYINRMV